ELDDLDISILKMLTTNSRMSDHSIAKKLQVTTNTVKNRIRNLMKEGVLQGFETHLSATFFNATHCWLSAQLYGNEPEGKIVEELGKIDKVSFIMPTTENLMLIAMDFFNSTDLDNTIQQMSGRKGITGIQTYIYSSQHLHKKIDISPLDWKIIRSIRFNSRKSPSEIARECGISTRTVNRRLRRLYDGGVIHHIIAFDPMESKGTIVYGIFAEYDARFPRDKIVKSVTGNVKNLFNDFVMVNSPTILMIFFGKRFSDIYDNENAIKAVEGVRSIKTYFCTKVYHFKDWRDNLIEKNVQ
ncbi:MAG: winged helix-turn-helix transcriptional regulator, partial [Candidatus Bathyarchaeota archaeon]|nr:winged helix-turn-helix transcriptional regulator [Candidatus Bathyarchaeota archaeon]